jgi:hypothetical protein
MFIARETNRRVPSFRNAMSVVAKVNNHVSCGELQHGTPNGVQKALVGPWSINISLLTEC